MGGGSKQTEREDNTGNSFISGNTMEQAPLQATVIRERECSDVINPNKKAKS